MRRSAFIRTNSTGIRPTFREPATLAKPSSDDSTVTPSCSVVPSAVGSKAKPSTHSRSTSSMAMASRAAALMNDGLTVPYCGPTTMPTRDGVSLVPPSPVPLIDSPPRRSPTAWT